MKRAPRVRVAERLRWLAKHGGTATVDQVAERGWLKSECNSDYGEYITEVVRAPWSQHVACALRAAAAAESAAYSNTTANRRALCR